METQLTPGSHTPDIPFHPQMIQEFRTINCWARGFGVCETGVCWKVLRDLFFFAFFSLVSKSSDQSKMEKNLFFLCLPRNDGEIWIGNPKQPFKNGCLVKQPFPM